MKNVRVFQILEGLDELADIKLQKSLWMSSALWVSSYVEANCTLWEDSNLWDEMNENIVFSKEIDEKLFCLYKLTSNLYGEAPEQLIVNPKMKEVRLLAAEIKDLIESNILVLGQKYALSQINIDSDKLEKHLDSMIKQNPQNKDYIYFLEHGYICSRKRPRYRVLTFALCIEDLNRSFDEKKMDLQQIRNHYQTLKDWANSPNTVLEQKNLEQENLEQFIQDMKQVGHFHVLEDIESMEVAIDDSK